MRTKIIAGNWKMNNTAADATALINDLNKEIEGIEGVEVVACPTYTALAASGEALKGSSIGLGAQNMHFEANGAYTGEISAAMLKELGVQYVILGHSERRQYFAETDEVINKKTKVALNEGLVPLVCVGETLDERESGVTETVVVTQLKGCLDGLSTDEAAKTVVAYEPVWAIGTGKVATPEQAQEVHATIRQTLTDLFGEETAEKVRIQYGGSMKPGNAAELLSQKDIDGGLIGGAALDAVSFIDIVRAAV